MKENKLKVYSIYTNSHSTLFNNFFLPSLGNTDLELHITKIEQSGFGDYNSEDYLNSILLKVRLIISAIKENFGGVFVFSDVDIVFFKNVSSDLFFRLKDNDILFQFQPNMLYDAEINTGFFMCRANNKTLNLWQECEKRVLNSISLNIKMHDQDFINQIIKENPIIIKFKFLPFDRYSTYLSHSLFNKSKKNNVYLSKNVHIFHAIQTTYPSIINKEALLSEATRVVLSNQGMNIIVFYLNILHTYFLRGLIFFIKKYFSIHRIVGQIGFFLKKNIPWLFKILKPYFPNAI